MYKELVVIFFLTAVTARPQKHEKPNGTPNYAPNEFELEQNRAARYEFSSSIEDNINDLSHQREEVREGLNVKGSYSYSDGYYQRTVFYEADDKGYRVTKTEVTPLEGGPNIDLMGTASVNNNAHGRTVAYRVQSVPVPGPVPKVITEA
ncbi:uncharacterized protein LOC135142284 [Zophobas morio]|uniref:uncharacterized protein LOC135142284 n=1 Tax=Zophobas morio TaxID=2755281 RepID=UPI003082D3E3